MRLLKNDDYQLIERIVGATQKELLHTLHKYLQDKYKSVTKTKDYIVAVGDIPIALVAHLDTVFAKPVKKLYYDQRKSVMWSSDGLGADDRAGVFAIIKIIQSGLRPSIIFTTDEEKGGLGAEVLSKQPCPIPNLKYMIELDRRGTNDCVFYDCYNPDFIHYIEAFGFVEAFGSFSDISWLMPAWKICGVNLSVGYEDEHSYSETLCISALYDTIDKVKNMLKAVNIPTFEYKDLSAYPYVGWSYTGTQGRTDYGAHCAGCHNLFSEFELIPTKAANGGVKFYCPDCVTEHVNWCNYCGEPYERTDYSKKDMCPDCEEVKSNV